MTRMVWFVIALAGWLSVCPPVRAEDQKTAEVARTNAKPDEPERLDVVLLDHDDEEFRVKGPDGKARTIPMRDVAAYRTQDGVPQIRLHDGTLLILSEQIAGEHSSSSDGIWRATRRKHRDGSFSLPSLPKSLSGAKGKEAFDRGWKAAQHAFSQDMTPGELALAGAAAIVNIASLICFLILVVVMFHHGSITTGILCLLTTCCCGIGPIIALFSGWANAAPWGITKLMTAYTLLMILGLMLGVARVILYPESLAEFNATACGYPG